MVQHRFLDAQSSDFSEQLRELLAFADSTDVTGAVGDILREVRTRGDEALCEYIRRFDRFDVAQAAEIRIDEAQLAGASIPSEQEDALRQAAAQIRRFHERQRDGYADWEYTDDDGNRLGQRFTPLDSVAVYIPGGSAAYPSSVLMNIIPALIAGVRRIVVVTPLMQGAGASGVLVALRLLGATEIYRMGGAHALGAVAYGTGAIPKVDKIVGPGNRYVAEAKRQLFGIVGIDSVAGPSEGLIISDGSISPQWVAWDLIAQAEHDADAQSILISPDAAHLSQVACAMDRHLETTPRAAIIAQSLQNRGALIHVADLAQACAVANDIASEHLQIMSADMSVCRDCLAQIRHAGSIFLGAHSPIVIGDYGAGPNHVLPTGRTARFSSPLGVHDFMKISSIVTATESGCRAHCRMAARIAKMEGLIAHESAARARLEDSEV